MKPADDVVTAVPLDSDFTVGFANEIARLESYNKHHYRPNSYLHKWWARRCGSTFRLILKHLVGDEEKRDYYTPGGLQGKTVLDPMMGGGTTLHEAIRLGANVIGADLDPIPVLQARATLTDVPLVPLEKAFKYFYKQLRADLDPYFLTSCPYCGMETPMRFMLHGLRRYCDCGPVLVADSLELRRESDGTIIRIDPHSHNILRDGDVLCAAPTGDKLPIVEKRTKSCGTCERPYRDENRPYYARYQPLVVVGRCRNRACRPKLLGRKLFFRAPDWIDREARQRAEDLRGTLPFAAADFAVESGRKSIHLKRRGITSYLDLFSTRQLLVLDRAVDILSQFDGDVRLKLALLVSTSLEFNSMLCGYKGKNMRRAGAIRHTFSHHAYSFPYTALENNPLYYRKNSGTLKKLFHARIRRARRWAQLPRERVIKGFGPFVNGQRFVAIEGEVDAGREVTETAAFANNSHRFLLLQGSSTRLDLDDNSVDYIVTDPPYYDSVQYSDLAAFFRVWLRQLLPDAADWGYDVGQSAVDPHKNDRESRYGELIGGIFAECHRVLRKENGRFIFTFHHWNPKGWAALTWALKQAGFVLVNRYVVHAENPVSVHINNMNALLHDAILVCAPGEAEIGGEWARPEAVNHEKSESFCRDCGALLGWMLNQEDLTETAVKQLWRDALN